jgi:hypothetical protein
MFLDSDSLLPFLMHHTLTLHSFIICNDSSNKVFLDSDSLQLNLGTATGYKSK